MQAAARFRAAAFMKTVARSHDAIRLASWLLATVHHLTVHHLVRNTRWRGRRWGLLLHGSERVPSRLVSCSTGSPGRPVPSKTGMKLSEAVGPS